MIVPVWIGSWQNSKQLLLTEHPKQIFLWFTYKYHALVLLQHFFIYLTLRNKLWCFRKWNVWPLAPFPYDFGEIFPPKPYLNARASLHWCNGLVLHTYNCRIIWQVWFMLILVVFWRSSWCLLSPVHRLSYFSLSVAVALSFSLSVLSSFRLSFIKSFCVSSS